MTRKKHLSLFISLCQLFLLSLSVKSSFLSPTIILNHVNNSNELFNQLNYTSTAFNNATNLRLIQSTFTTKKLDTTITSTTSISTSTTSTTTTKKPRLNLLVTEFNLTNVSTDYSRQNQNVNISYAIRTNSTSSTQEQALKINMSIICTAEEQQSWSKLIFNLVVVNDYLQSSTSLSPLQGLSPKPGSLIKCTAQTLTDLQNLTSTAYLLVDPSPATNLSLSKINETVLELSWKKPENFYDSLDLICDTEKSSLLSSLFNVTTKLEKKIDKELNLNADSKYLLVNLLPGSNYSCFLVSNRNSNQNNLTSKVKSDTVSQTTDLSHPTVLASKLNDLNRSIEIELNPPNGLYDYFTLNLVDVESNQNNNDLVMSRNFSSEHTKPVKAYFPENDDKPESIDLLVPGRSYEIWSSIYQLLTDKKKHVKILDQILVQPEPVQEINIFILSNSSINVTWQAPSIGLYKSFSINLFSTDSTSKASLTSKQNFIVIDKLKPAGSYLIEVFSCSSRPNSEECESKSESRNKSFSFNNQRIFNLNQSLRDTDLQINWDMSDAHDFKNYKVNLQNLNSNQTIECLFEIDGNQSCPGSWHLACSNSSKCLTRINQLNFNTNYSIMITPISKSLYEFPSASFSFRTKASLPDKDYQTSISYDVQSRIEWSSLISIYLPQINQTNGAITSSYLFLVKLGNIQEFNQTRVFKLEKLRDQLNLKLIIETSPICSNETSILEPCLLKSYGSDESSGSNERVVFIGQFSENIEKILNISNAENETKIDYENITTSLIEPSNLYQLFFVFKIGDVEQLYFATRPTEPIHTKPPLNFNLSNSNQNRDGLALWIIIVICVVSSVFLIGVIITLVILTLIKYKPSKFHKAAQLVAGSQQQNARIGQPLGNIGNTLNMRSKFDRHDEYMGNCDFVLPGEFSRYEMTNIWLVKHANGDLILDDEYRNLPDYRDYKTCYASQMTKNELKNRFLDIKAYDDSRVILHSNSSSLSCKKADQTSVEKCLLSTSSICSSTRSHSSAHDLDTMPCQNGDYINANFIQGYSHDKKFIATQGPKKETLNDFWRMIYQYKVSAVVMLTKLVEKGVERCTQYWPDKLNITETYGDLEVTLKDQQKCGDYVKRTFDLMHVGLFPVNNSTTPLSLSNPKILTVNQYYYPEWPDKDTPSTDPISILHLIRDVNQNHLTYQYPIVVHCSAGVGRTGTYITLDAMMEKISSESKIDIFGFISKIRERRQYLVQTSKQYIFIHEALYEYCLYGFTDIEVGHLVAHYKSLKEPAKLNVNGQPFNSNSNIHKSRLQIEFEKLCVAFYPNCQAREAFNNENKHRNRDLNTICYDDNRIRLSALNGSSYINATMIKGFELSNELIITQDPMQTTEFEFWKMITEYDCNVIVALNKDFELEKESVYWPSEDKPIRHCEYDDVKFVIQIIAGSSSNSELSNELITKREFEIVEYKYSGTHKMNVTHFIYNEQWADERAPRNRSAFLELVGQVQKTAVKFERSRIAVHAYGGGSNCAVFCALNVLLYQFKNDQYLDVCRSVKKLKTQRPHMIETFEQYEFLYQCLVDFVDMFGIYSQSCDSFNSRTSLNESLACLKFPQQQKEQFELTKLNQIKLNFN